MDSRTVILNRISKPEQSASLPDTPDFDHQQSSAFIQSFINVLRSIGGTVLELENIGGLKQYITETFDDHQERIVSAVPGLEEYRFDGHEGNQRELNNVFATVLQASFGVAENGAVWITDDALPDRVLPFITQHLIVTISATDLVATMHDAYDRIGDANYSFGTFIAGPSKTADIEQSLVLGAHGPKSMTVVILRDT